MASVDAGEGHLGRRRIPWNEVASPEGASSVSVVLVGAGRGPQGPTFHSRFREVVHVSPHLPLRCGCSPVAPRARSGLQTPPRRAHPPGTGKYRNTAIRALKLNTKRIISPPPQSPSLIMEGVIHHERNSRKVSRTVPCSNVSDMVTTIPETLVIAGGSRTTHSHGRAPEGSGTEVRVPSPDLGLVVGVVSKGTLGEVDSRDDDWSTPRPETQAPQARRSRKTFVPVLFLNLGQGWLDGRRWDSGVGFRRTGSALGSVTEL